MQHPVTWHFAIRQGLGISSGHAGVLRAVVWTLESKSETHAAACCIYVVTLHIADNRSLTEGDAHLLIKAKLPPHAVCCHVVSVTCVATCVLSGISFHLFQHNALSLQSRQNANRIARPALPSSV